MLELYKNIKKLRLEKGWSQTQLAKKAGYNDRSAIAHIEAGSIDLPQSKIRLFAEIFGVTPAYLFGGNVPMPTMSVEELDIIDAYRALTYDQQAMICQMLGVKRDAESISLQA